MRARIRVLPNEFGSYRTLRKVVAQSVFGKGADNTIMRKLVEQTNQQLWDEIIRLVRVMKSQSKSLERFDMAVARVIPLDESCLPIHYVSDAIILVDLVERLETRGARPD